MNVGQEIALLKKMVVAELRTKYAEVFGEATRAGNKDWLVKRITWRMQAKAEGDLSERARRRAEELACDADLRTTSPRTAPAPEVATGPRIPAPFWNERRLPPAGTILVREYKGQRREVLVLPRGFEFEGVVYKSLSAVAKAISGSHVNGYHFFRLNGEAVQA